jgi:hypothetical protein
LVAAVLVAALLVTAVLVAALFPAVPLAATVFDTAFFAADFLAAVFLVGGCAADDRDPPDARPADAVLLAARRATPPSRRFVGIRCSLERPRS